MLGFQVAVRCLCPASNQIRQNKAEHEIALRYFLTGWTQHYPIEFHGDISFRGASKTYRNIALDRIRVTETAASNAAMP